MSQDGEDQSPRGASAPEKPGSGDDGDSDNRSILVSNIPATMNDDKVMIHFQRLSNGGGDVRKVTRLSSSQAKVMFEDVKVIGRVIARKHETDGVTLTVEAWSSFLGRALERDRAILKQSSNFQQTTLQIHQSMSQDAWAIYQQKLSKTKITTKRSAKSDVVTFKGSWHSVVKAGNLLFDFLDETNAAKSSLSRDSKESEPRYGHRQVGEGATDNLEKRHDTPSVIPPDDGQHELQAAVNKGTENPDEDQPADEEGLKGKTMKEVDATRPYQRRGGKSHDASGGRNASEITESDQRRDDSTMGFTKSESVEPRKGNGLKEAMGNKSSSRLQQSISAPDGASSACGSSNIPTRLKQDTMTTPPSPESFRGAASSKHRFESKMPGRKSASSTSTSTLHPETASAAAESRNGHLFPHNSGGRARTGGTYGLADMYDDEDDNDPKNSMTESTVEQNVEPDILSYIIKVHSLEITAITERHKVIFRHNEEKTVVCIKGLKKNAGDAMEDFISLYQGVFNKIKSLSLDTNMHGIKSEVCSYAVECVHKSNPSVFVKNTDGNVLFIGIESDVRSARAEICSILKISESRRRQPRASSTATSAGAGPAQASTTPVFADPSTGGKVVFQDRIGGIQICVVEGDITRQTVDIIVSAANSSLSLNWGVSGAISRAGGSSIQAECDAHRRLRGYLKTTDCVWTKGGFLPCKFVIHAVGPMYNAVYGSHRCQQELHDTCHKILTMASSELKAVSIAMPAISSGACGMPRDLCAESMFSAITDFIENVTPTHNSLIDIRIIDNDRRAAEVFSDVFSKMLAKFNSSKVNATGLNWQPRYPPGSTNPSSSANSPGTGYSGAGSTPVYQGTSQASPSLHVSQVTQSSGQAHYASSNPTQSSRGQAYQATNQNSTSFTSSAVTPALSAAGNSDKDDTCPICLCDFTAPVTTPQCKHKFCTDCLDRAMKVSGQCPVCKTVIGRLKGNQPMGMMTNRTDFMNTLPGHEDSTGIIEISYSFPSGTQGLEHPNPGRPYTGTSRRAYLPNNTEGREVLRLLERAFYSNLVFTIGTSATTGMTDTVVWNDIHHKTSKYGGPNSYGYPDPDYLRRVKEELAAKGIK